MHLYKKKGSNMITNLKNPIAKKKQNKCPIKRSGCPFGFSSRRVAVAFNMSSDRNATPPPPKSTCPTTLEDRRGDCHDKASQSRALP